MSEVELNRSYKVGIEESFEKWHSNCKNCSHKKWERIAWLAACADVDRYREALEEISLGKGAFSQDQLTHATNTIEDMKALAQAALAGESKK